MNIIEEYLQYCESQRRLDKKTLKAYRIDLSQFSLYIGKRDAEHITGQLIESYIASLNSSYKAKTVKRKIASIKAFFGYLEDRGLLEVNPFHKLRIRFREPVVLPRTISLHNIESLLLFMYKQRKSATTEEKRRRLLRDTAIIEVLFATGIRISELCSLKPEDIDIFSGKLMINGKGKKERILQIVNKSVLRILEEYNECYKESIESSGFYWVNRCGKRLSEQSVREMLKKYSSAAGIHINVTPHMFRHSFATYLLEEDVDIRYIQEMMGHSSIRITEIYTHVATAKQRSILEEKHPRNRFVLETI